MNLFKQFFHYAKLFLSMPNRLRILVVTEGTEAIKYITVKLKHITLGALGGMVFFFLVTIVFAYFIGLWVAERKMMEVSSKNQILKSQMMTLSTKVKALQQKLGELMKTDEMMRTGLGLPTINEETRQAGIGGTINPLTIEDETDELTKEIQLLEREMILQQQSYQEISEGIKRQQAIVEHTPSIRPMATGFFGSSFGYRRDPFTGKIAMHEGIDINVPVGTPVYATAPGVVKIAKYLSNYGQVVVIDHYYGYQTVYAHLSSYRVRVGEKVKRGDIIAFSGNSGRSTGPHLHYEVRQNNRPVDPMDFLFDTFAFTR
ncbi:MAG: M23 family metallopeptidase [bacterium]|nr:M23 family metallopeptidase [bacterium]